MFKKKFRIPEVQLGKRNSGITRKRRHLKMFVPTPFKA